MKASVTLLVLATIVMTFVLLSVGYHSASELRVDATDGSWCRHYKHFMVCSIVPGSDYLYKTY